MRRITTLIILSLGLLPVMAQETPKDSITYLEEVIVTDPAIDKGLGIVEYQTIGASLLSVYGPVATAATINQIPGVYALSGALNTNRITIRGVGSRTLFGTDKLRMYYENIPVTNGTGFSTIEAFDLENLYAIDVVKGPKATAYGAALGGALLLRVGTGTEATNQLQYNVTAGSYGLVKNNISLKLKEKAASYKIALNQMNTEGYRENNAFYRKGVLVNTVFNLSPKQHITVLINYIDYRAQIPSSLSLQDFEENPKQAAFTWKASRGYEANKYILSGLSHETDLGGSLSLSNTIFYSYLDHYEPRPFNILDEFTNTYGLRSVLAGNKSESPLTYYLGLELLKDEYSWSTYENLYRENNDMGSLQGEQLSNNKEYRRQFFAFSTMQYAFSASFLMQVGIQANRTIYDFRDLFNTGIANRSARREFSWLFLPSLDLRYMLRQELHLYASVSRGFSNPSLEETLTPDGVINPEIDQETGVQLELGTTWQPFKNSLVELSLFQMNIKNLLVADRVGEDQFIGRNAGSTRLKGIELLFKHSFPLSANSNLKNTLSYTHSAHRFLEFIDGGENFSGNKLTGVPANRLHFRSELSVMEKFKLSATYDYVGKMPITDGNTLFSEAYHLFSGRASFKQLVSKNFTIYLNLGIENLFNRRYAQSVLINATGFGGAAPRYYYPGNGRNFYSGLSLNWFL